MAMSTMLRRLTRRRGVDPDGAYQPADYWRRRYSSLRPTIRAVGNSGLTDAQNKEDYEVRWNAIRAALEGVHPDPEGLSLFDAGCGIGLFSERCEALGYRVVGVDIAQRAADEAARRCRGRFLAGDLATVDLGESFSVVTAFGVLICVADDGHWHDALVNMLRHVRPDGYFLLLEHTFEEQTDAAVAHLHLKWREIGAYETVLDKQGFALERVETVLLPHEPRSQTLLLARRHGAPPT